MTNVDGVGGPAQGEGSRDDVSVNGVIDEPREEQRPPQRRFRLGQMGVLLVVGGVLAVIMLSTGRRPPPASTSSQGPARSLSGDDVSQIQRELEAQERLLSDTQARLRNELNAQPPVPASDLDAPVQPSTEDPLKRQQRELEYRSLFADNVAFTARPQSYGQQQRAPAGVAAAASAAEREKDEGAATEAAFRRTLEAVADQAAAVAGGARSGGTSQPGAAPVPPATPPPASSGAAPEVSRDGLTPGSTPPLARVAAVYTLLEGDVIETVLTNQLQGEFAGPVNVMVTTPVYSRDTVHLLIPAGSRLLGHARRVATGFQQRLAVSFHRLLLPDGRTVGLDDFTGLDQVGATGLKDKVNQHYWATIGAAAAVGLIQGLSYYGFGYGQGQGDRTVIVAQGGAGASEGLSRMLDRYTNRMPTITIGEGTRVKVLVARDLALPEYVDSVTPRTAAWQ